MTYTMTQNKRYTLYIVLTSLLLAGSGFQVGYSQQMGIPHTDYLRAIGLEEEGNQIKQRLMDGLKERTPWMPDQYFENNADFFSMVLLLSGITPQKYTLLENEGIDIINAVTADTRPFKEQALLADLSVTGFITSIYVDEQPGDGFDITVEVAVTEFLKGSALADTIQIRQHSSRESDDRDTSPELGHSYFLLLSSGMYGYQSANHRFRETGEAIVTAPEPGKENRFVIYRIHPFKNGELIHSNEDAESAFRELRKINRLIH